MYYLTFKPLPTISTARPKTLQFSTRAELENYLRDYLRGGVINTMTLCKLPSILDDLDRVGGVDCAGFQITSRS